MKTVMLLLLLAASAATAGAADLYRVDLKNVGDAEQLQACAVEPIIRLNDGYLVLAESETGQRLTDLGLKVGLIAADVEKSELALDRRLDDANVDRFPLLFQDGQLRLYRVDLSDPSVAAMQPELMPIRNEHLQITFRPSRTTRPRADKGALVDLDSLLSLVSQDSLQSYTEALQAFDGRVYGTQGNYDARDWIEDKFVEFGYDDSIYIFPFTYNSASCGNVVATKVGSRFPDRQIIVGAHFDAVPGSPGADDNGSGSAGVLELARVLRDIETDMTFVFICFDTEEAGLVGSYYYAQDAYASGDNIVYMFNLDMIGDQDNYYDVTVYHGDDVSYSELYNYFADSLLSLTGHLSGNSSGSDHYYFTQLGYTATFIIEYNFSSVYHSPNDSTTHMSFPYHTRLAQSALAATYYVSQTEGPLPELTFGYPYGRPEWTLPGEELTFDVSVDGVFDGVPVPGSGQLHCNVDGQGWTTSALTENGDLYEATLPGGDCYDIIEFYLSMEEATEGVFTDPYPSDPYEVVVATEQLVPLEDNFETDLGWTTSYVDATNGYWERGVPVDADDWDYDPAADGDGSGSCYLTENATGNTDVDNGSVTLQSPSFDMSNGGAIEYYYYLYLSQPEGEPDRMVVEINSDGGVGDWYEIAVHNVNGGLSWRYHSISQSEILAAGAEFSSTMMVRFVASDPYPGSIVEAGVDGFRAVAYDCVNPWVCGDADNNGVGPDIADLVYLVLYMFQDGPAPEFMGTVDVNGDGAGPNIEDLVYLALYMFQEGDALNCQ